MTSHKTCKDYTVVVLRKMASRRKIPGRSYLRTKRSLCKALNIKFKQTKPVVPPRPKASSRPHPLRRSPKPAALLQSIKSRGSSDLQKELNKTGLVEIIKTAKSKAKTSKKVKDVKNLLADQPLDVKRMIILASIPYGHLEIPKKFSALCRLNKAFASACKGELFWKEVVMRMVGDRPITKSDYYFKKGAMASWKPTDGTVHMIRQLMPSWKAVAVVLNKLTQKAYHDLGYSYQTIKGMRSGARRTKKPLAKQQQYIKQHHKTSKILLRKEHHDNHYSGAKLIATLGLISRPTPRRDLQVQEFIARI